MPICGARAAYRASALVPASTSVGTWASRNSPAPTPLAFISNTNKAVSIKAPLRLLTEKMDHYYVLMGPWSLIENNRVNKA